MSFNLPSPDPEADAKVTVGLISVRLAEVAAFGEGLPETWFDYGDVPEATRDELRQLTADIKNAHRPHLAVVFGNR